MSQASARVICIAVLIAAVAVFFTVRISRFAQAGNEPAAQAVFVPTITATNNDALVVDNDGDGRADPGDTLEYTVTINNTAAPGAGNDATATVFTTTLSQDLTLVGMSVNASPIGFNDAYSVTGNVQIQVPDGVSDVLANDIDPDTGTNGGLTASGGATSTNGGNVTINANGSFSYNPPAGFTGTDTYTYTVTDASGATGTGIITFTVSDMIWFVNASAGGGGDGRLTNPFNCFVGAGCFSAVAADDPGDNIFLYNGNYTGGYTLLNNQRLIGQGASAALTGAGSITGITVAAFSDALPATNGNPDNVNITTTAAATNAVTLGQGNTLRGFHIGNTTGAKILGNNYGTLTAGNNTTPDLRLSGNGQAINLLTGSFAATSGFNSVQTLSSTNGGVQLNATGGTVSFGSTQVSGSTAWGVIVSNSTVNANFGNTTVGTGTAGSGGTDAIRLENNTSGTRTFGAVTIQNNTGDGIIHTSNGGLTNITGATAITNSGARGIFMTNSTAGNGMTFQNTTVNGSASIGVFLTTNAGAISFADLDIDTDANVRAFQATSNTGAITTTSGAFADTGTATAVEIVGPSAVSRTPLNMTLTSVSSAGGATANGIVVENTSSTGFVVTGTGSTAASGGTIGGRSGTDGQTTNGIGVYLNNADNISLSNMTFNGNFDNFGIRGTNVNNFTLRDSTANSAAADNGGFGTSNAADEGVVSFDNLTGTALFEGNNLSDGHEDIIVIENTAGALNFTVQDSANDPAVIGRNGEQVGSATGNDGILVTTSGSASLTMNVTGVVFEGWRGDGIQTDARGASTQNITLSNNTFHNGHLDIVSGGGGISLGLSAATGGGPNVNYAITGNSFRGAEGNVINLSAIGPSGAMSGTVLNNTIGNNNGVHNANQADTGSNAGGSGIFVRVEKDDGGGTLTHAVRIENNDIGDIVNGIGGIHLLANGGVSGNGTARVEATIRNNRIDENGVNIAGGVYADIGGAGGNDNARMGLNTENNNINMTGSTNAIAALVLGDLTNNAQYYFPGYGGPYTDAGLAAFHTGPEGNTFTVSGFVQQVTTAPTGTFATGNNFVLLPVPSAEEMPGEAVSTSTDSPFQSEEGVALREDGVFHPEDGILRFAESVSSYADGIFQTAHGMVRSAGGDLGAFAREFVAKSGEIISPTVYAEPLSGETVTVNGGGSGFTLPAGKSVTIRYRATIDAPPPFLTQVSNQGTVSGSNFANVLTDDPAAGGATDPTATVVDSTTVVVTSSQNPSLTGQPVTFTATLTGAPSHGAADPGGTVEFFEDGNSLGAPVAVNAGTLNDNTGTAQIVVSNLPTGSHVISAVFSGGGTGPGGFNANSSETTGGSNVTQTVGNTAVWDGSASTDWNTAANWATNFVPTATNSVSLPASGVTNQPNLSAQDTTVVDLAVGANRTLTIAGGRTLTITGVLTMNGLNIDATAGLLEIGGAGSVVRTSGVVLGPMRKVVTSAPIAGESPQFVFVYPVGTATGFSPLSADFTAGSGSLTVAATDGTSPSMLALNDATTLDRYWTMTEAGDLTASLTFTYLQADVDGIEANYRLIRTTTGGVAIGSQNGSPCPGAGSPCVDATANTIFVSDVQSFDNHWTAGELLPPTAANVDISGRVVTAEGRGVSRARVSLTDGNGNVRYSLTNGFGYYRFLGVESGREYVVAVTSKQFAFTPRLIALDDNIVGLDFVALPRDEKAVSR